MDIYTYLAVLGLMFALTLIGLMKRAGLMNIFAMIIGLVASAEQLIDGALTVPFGNCFLNSSKTICGTVTASIGGDMPILLLALIVIANAAILIQTLRS